MLARLEDIVGRARRRRALNLLVVNLRILLAFAFLPAGLRKVLGQPFTDPANIGPFHEFLHAFLATGAFYPFVGVMQLVAAVLLFSQRFATAGALLLLPMLTAILVFCWSTGVYFTAVVVTLMFLANLGLIVWDLQKLRALFAPDDRPIALTLKPLPAVIDLRLWQGCGFGILALYLTATALAGEIYRPRGVELDNPAFYLLPLLALLPVVTWLLDRARYRRRVTPERLVAG